MIRDKDQVVLPLNRRATILTSQDVRNSIGHKRADAAMELHLEVLSNSSFVLAYKPQNYSIQECMTLSYLPEINSEFGWADFIEDDQFVLMLGSSRSLSYLIGAEHIVMDATHDVCKVRENRIISSF